MGSEMDGKGLKVIESLLMANISSVEDLEEILDSHPSPEIPTINRYVNQMYVKEIVIPKDSILTGRVHMYGYVDIMLSGDITVATKEGIRRYKGVNIFEGMAGRKRAGYAHEETRWITVHRVEDREGAFNYEKEQTFRGLPDYNRFTKERDNASYLSLIDEIGIPQEQVDLMLENMSDYEESNLDIMIKDSEIHGKGMFSLSENEGGTVLGFARRGGKRTALGRYVNHSENPNIECVMHGDDALMVTTRKVFPDEELTSNYSDTIMADYWSKNKCPL